MALLGAYIPERSSPSLSHRNHVGTIVDAFPIILGSDLYLDERC